MPFDRIKSLLFGTAGPTAQGSPVSQGRIAAEILRLTNAERRRHGLHELVECPRLRQAALGHSSDMCARGFFSHASPVRGRETMKDRARAAGVTDLALSENIFMCESAEPAGIARMVVEGWMQSRGHRENILRRPSNRIGVGVASSGRRYLATQNFAHRTLTLQRVQAGRGSILLEGSVVEGPREGVLFVGKAIVARWTADPTGFFRVRFELARPATIAVGQARPGSNVFDIVCEFRPAL